MQTATSVRRFAVAAAVAGFTVALSPASGAFAAEQEQCQGSGRAYGQYHAELARSGKLGAERNPGDHRGYSSCR